MKRLISIILQLLEDTYHEIKDIKNLMIQNQSAYPTRMLNKNQVMSLLHISDTTYRRYVKSGRLKPMRLHGIDMYREDDLIQELEESRRKGRL